MKIGTAPRRAVIFDLDGTLADLDHRLPLIKGEVPKWDEFFSECLFDSPHDDIIALTRVLGTTRDVIIVSGRSDSVRDRTVSWLQGHGVNWDILHMRKHGDHRPDYQIKKEIYLDHIAENYEVEYVFDDRDQVVEMWRELGLRTLQVAEGTF